MKTEEQYPRQYLYRQIVKAKLFIDSNYASHISLDRMANEAHFSKYHFIRLFSEICGKTPNQYLSHVRIEKAKKLLQLGAKTDTVCYTVGYESPGTFKGLFKKITGATPAGYRKKYTSRNTDIKHTPSKFLPHCFTRL